MGIIDIHNYVRHFHEESMEAKVLAILLVVAVLLGGALVYLRNRPCAPASSPSFVGCAPETRRASTVGAWPRSRTRPEPWAASLRVTSGSAHGQSPSNASSHTRRA